MEEMHRARFVARAWSFHVLWECHPPSTSNLAAHQISLFKSFHRAQPAATLSFLEVSEWSSKFPPSNHSVFIVTSAILRLSWGPTYVPSLA